MDSENKLHLTDLIDKDTLQAIQDAFSDMTGMASLTTDADGIAITEGSAFTDFCMKLTRPTEEGRKRCERCDINGAEITRKFGNSVSYRCHAGLVDFAAPIIANGEIVGSFIGGQVLVEPPYLPSVRETAVELGIDPDEYEAAIKKVPIVSNERVEKAAHSLFVIASTLSTMALKGYELHKSNLEIEKASKMKSDFLANMSHEIRTPMNAVIGLADLAMREEMPPAVREYIHQIKSSSKNLLVIINDILDFSKIESGKMDIVEVEYEPLSVIQDLTSIVNSRIGEKPIEFTMDISHEMPKRLYGDNVRIHQIILNLLTNAVKFTQRGEVHFEMNFESRGENEVVMKVKIADTGIGIKEKDMHKLFNSFQQVDSKRNRNIEGTGLGLAISKQLLELMGGTISLESEYEKGTTFTFEVPQKVVDGSPVMPPLDTPPKAAVLIENPYVKKQLIKDLERIGAEYIDCATNSNVTKLDKLDVDAFIVEKAYFTKIIQDFVAAQPEVQCLVLVPYDSIDVVEIPNVRVISKPAYSLSLYNAMGIHDIHIDSGESDGETFAYVAPDAHILIVDDNAVNLTVATGLLAPLQMTIDTAQSASAAIEKIHHTKYDLIFMDHMMPEVDGIEATHIIRRLVPSYNDVPIIALTANAVGGARDMFIREGMNDFVAKPIDLKDALSKLAHWLPKEKIVPLDKEGHAFSEEHESAETQSESGFKAADVTELNTQSALSMLGTENLFWIVLKEYYNSIEKKAKTILDHKAAENWRNYTIEVHALKSASRQIGADHLADAAYEMEKAGNAGDIALINEKTDALIEEYLELHKALAKYFVEEMQEIKPPMFQSVVVMLDYMHEALDNFDTLQIDEALEKISKLELTERGKEFFERLKTAAEKTDVDDCLKIIEEWGLALIEDGSTTESPVALLDDLQTALDDFDTLKIDEVVERMSHGQFPDDQQELFERLREAAESSDMEKCAEIASEWRKKLIT